MAAYYFLPFAACLLLFAVESLVQSRYLPSQAHAMLPTLEFDETHTAVGKGVYEYDLFYFMSMGQLHVVYITSDSSRIVKITPIEKGDTSANDTLPQDKGSGMSIEQLAGPQHVYTIHHHHAYIAVSQDIIELLLNPDSPNFHDRIHVGHTPLQVVVGDFGRETYLYVLYEENDRGYVAAYRKYSNRDWGKYRFHYRVSPCEHIVSINFNGHKRVLFGVCTNTTFSIKYHQFNETSHWKRMKLTNVSQDGKLAAMATNGSGDMTTLTITRPVDKEQVYTFQHFHHVGSRSMIINGEFVTVSKTQHYFCYIELGEFGILCLDIEQALTNVNTEGIIKDAMLRLPNTRSVSCSSYGDCPVMYAHHSLLVAQVQICDEECRPKVMLFNMSRIENIVNISKTFLERDSVSSYTH